MNKKIVGLIIFVAIFLSVGFAIKNNFNKEGYLEKTDSSKDVLLDDDKKEVEDDNTEVGDSDTQTDSMAKQENVFSMEEVAKHNDRNSCYSVIRGEVFDLTSTIDTHPGGPNKILSICGEDGTDAFVNKHGGSPRQENGLAKLKIGILK